MEEVATMPSNAQEFCLRWNNFHSSLVSALDGFKNDLDFVDVTLACEGQFLKAHKMLLSACSVFFRDLLKANPCQHPIVILPPEVRFIDLEKMLRFIYQGEVNVHQENLARFLKTAEMLKIRGLAEDNDKQKVFQSSSPRLPDGNGSDRTNDNSSVSPKRPRLSIETQSGSITDAPQTPNDENSRLSGPDSDSEMIPVKQEMIELKECDFETTDNETFLAETYLRESSSATSSNTSNTQPPQTHPAAPPPPGPLLPSYVPPPQIKAQDDSPLASNQDDLSQEFDEAEYDFTGPDPVSGGALLGLPFIGAASLTSPSVPWRRSASSEDGYVLCPQCKKPITSYNLNRHIKMVHSHMERAQCQICRKQFKNKYSLGTHMHRQHQGDPDHHKHLLDWDSLGPPLDYFSQRQPRNSSSYSDTLAHIRSVDLRLKNDQHPRVPQLARVNPTESIGCEKSAP